ncbi:hypothetical protein QRO11_21065 [Paracidovorax citrulli]|nr:hypothetical protein [Paracidovorax citrulli]MVT29676.1 hypothetical protein [Paracidovorax citrulli]MVT37904.1 hypothetical protein [Paracidovorax citrulli]UEG45949.1 hypothetical protein LKW27_20245 [Paracidovorax citrulli]UMT85257.1 hypothetical protein FRC75_18845 [Paracidovorax citrulli]UMT86758.1 hypothetical protein FRC90_01030 [Paracidovorax citrulli]
MPELQDRQQPEIIDADFREVCTTGYQPSPIQRIAGSTVAAACCALMLAAGFELIDGRIAMLLLLVLGAGGYLAYIHLQANRPGFVFFAAVALLAIGASVAFAGYYPLASLVALAVGGISGALARAARVDDAPCQRSTLK